MKHYTWSDDKNNILKHDRGAGFEDVVFFLENAGHILTLEHPNQKKYHGQKMYVADINGYVFLVPFRETDNEIHLITAFPSRKATKEYIKRDGEKS
jgi:uncharacterized DUF497 family protein